MEMKVEMIEAFCPCQGMALCVLRGAVMYGLHPEVVSVRKSQHTYGFGILKPFQQRIHPTEKRVVKENREWCADVFDPLVLINQSLHSGESVVRRYTPANPSQTAIILHIYSTDSVIPKVTNLISNSILNYSKSYLFFYV